MDAQYNAGYAEKTSALTPFVMGGIDAHQPPTITARLKGQKAELEHRLAKVNDALAAIEKNPDVQKVFDAISRAGF